ncbi:MAG: hypothetical protein WCK38_03640 [Candidatus Omnitrophota bacterium]
MFKNIVALVLVAVFLTAGTFVMAEGKSSCGDKNVLQCMYNWMAGCDKAPAKTAENSCMSCGKKCCQTCQTDCDCKCCAKCVKK